jgi:hypothetical protein
LCFSMLQWVIDQRGMEYGRHLLTTISRYCKAMFFDVSVNSGKACLHCYPGSERQFVEQLLREATSYPHITHLGDVHPYGDDARHVFYCHR